MLLEEICSLSAIIGKKAVIAFQQEHIREQDVQECEFHVIDASISDDWFLYHFDLKYKTCLSKKPATNHKNDDIGLMIMKTISKVMIATRSDRHGRRRKNKLQTSDRLFEMSEIIQLRAWNLFYRVVSLCDKALTPEKKNQVTRNVIQKFKKNFFGCPENIFLIYERLH